MSLGDQQEPEIDKNSELLNDPPKTAVKKLIHTKFVDKLVVTFGRDAASKLTVLIGALALVYQVVSSLREEPLIWKALFHTGLYVDLNSEYQRSLAIEKLRRDSEGQNSREFQKAQYNAALKHFANFANWTSHDPEITSAVSNITYHFLGDGMMFGKGDFELARSEIQKLRNLILQKKPLSDERANYVDRLHAQTLLLKLAEVEHYLSYAVPTGQATVLSLMANRNSTDAVAEYSDVLRAVQISEDARRKRSDGELCEAIRLAESANEISRSFRDDDALMAATIINRATWIYYDYGDLERAHENAKEALKLAESAYGKKHEYTVDFYYEYAHTLLSQDKYEEVLKFYNTRMNAIEPEKKPEAWRLNQKTFEAANSSFSGKVRNDSILREHYEKRKGTLGSESVYTALAGVELGSFLFDSGDTIEGMEKLNHALTVFGETESTFSKGYVQTSCRLAKNYIELEQYEKSVELLYNVLRSAKGRPRALVWCAPEDIISSIASDRSDVPEELGNALSHLVELKSSNSNSCEFATE